jgi:hypothetical protein
MESIDRDSQQAVLDAYDNSKSTKKTSGLTRADVNHAAQVLGMTSMQAKDISALSAIGLEAETQGVVRLGLGMVLMSTNSQIKALRKIEEKLDNAEFDEEPDQLIAAAKVAGDLGKNIASNGKTLVDVAKEGLIKDKKSEKPKYSPPPPPGIAMQVNGDVHLNSNQNKEEK